MQFQAHQRVVIIGAGPFGLSIAAHLRSAGIDLRIFGRPMYRWRFQMPKGMFLKSEGCASNLSEPSGRYTLLRYCGENGLPYGEWGTPVSLESFTRYALAFQRALVPDVEEVMVTGVESTRDGFELQLANGTTETANKVIVATGLEYAAHIPPVLAGLPREFVSHSADHHDLSSFQGKDVTIIGGGQSALETAVLLSEQGASARVIVRKPSVVWNTTPNMNPRSRYQRIRYPRSSLGQGIETWVYCNAPTLFRYLPLATRLEKVRTTQGPAGAWWLKDRLDGRLQILLGHSIRSAETRDGCVVLQAARLDGRAIEVTAGHVIAATGYRFDIQRLRFLSEHLKSRIHIENALPILSPRFECSVPGLYFTGLSSMNYFGPAMRFLAGADYTARTICRHIANGSCALGPQPASTPARVRICGEFE